MSAMKDKKIFYKILGFYYDFKGNYLFGFALSFGLFLDFTGDLYAVYNYFGYLLFVLALAIIMYMIIFPFYFDIIKNERFKKILRYLVLLMILFNLILGSIWLINFKSMIIKKKFLNFKSMSILSVSFFYLFYSIFYPFTILYRDKFRNIYLRILFFILFVAILCFSIYTFFAF